MASSAIKEWSGLYKYGQLEKDFLTIVVSSLTHFLYNPRRFGGSAYQLTNEMLNLCQTTLIYVILVLLV